MSDSHDTRRFEAIAHPRLGLLGNPSDAYGGRVIAFTFDDFAARVVIEVGITACIGALSIDGAVRSLTDLSQVSVWLADEATPGGSRLQLAALHQFAAHAPDATGALVGRGVRMSMSSDIPRQAGLAGSSAIVIATLRALGDATGASMSPFDLAEAALRAETDDLGYAAGPQDRVIQTYEGLLFMDFALPRDRSGYEALDASLLPPTFVVWRGDPGRDSGRIHGDVRGRFERGDESVVSAMAEFATFADAGLSALKDGDVSGLRRLVDQNFDLRARLFQVPDEERMAIDLGREHGAAMKFPGSGGAALGVARDAAHRDRLIAMFKAHRWNAIAPTLVDSALENPSVGRRTGGPS